MSLARRSAQIAGVENRLIQKTERIRTVETMPRPEASNNYFEEALPTQQSPRQIILSFKNDGKAPSIVSPSTYSASSASLPKRAYPLGRDFVTRFERLSAVLGRETGVLGDHILTEPRPSG